MKKPIISLILALIVAACLTACSKEKGQDYLNAQVLEITETELLVMCIDEFTGQLTDTTISVSKDIISADGIPELAVGDEIRVVYDFNKVDKLGDPVKIKQVYAIYLLSENGSVIPN